MLELCAEGTGTMTMTEVDGIGVEAMLDPGTKGVDTGYPEEPEGGRTGLETAVEAGAEDKVVE